MKNKGGNLFNILLSSFTSLTSFQPSLEVRAANTGSLNRNMMAVPSLYDDKAQISNPVASVLTSSTHAALASNIHLTILSRHEPLGTLFPLIQ